MTYPQYNLYDNDMDWVEFRAKLIGLSGDTPLGRIIQIRSETDPEILKSYTSEMKRIRDEWLNKQAKEKRESITTNNGNIVAIGAKSVQTALRQLFGNDNGNN